MKPVERLTTASEAVAKPDGFQNINGVASRNGPTLDEKTCPFLSLCRKSLHSCFSINIVTKLIKFLPQCKCQRKF